MLLCPRMMYTAVTDAKIIFNLKKKLLEIFNTFIIQEGPFLRGGDQMLR